MKKMLLATLSVCLVAFSYQSKADTYCTYSAQTTSDSWNIFINVTSDGQAHLYSPYVRYTYNTPGGTPTTTAWVPLSTSGFRNGGVGTGSALAVYDIEIQMFQYSPVTGQNTPVGAPFYVPAC